MEACIAGAAKAGERSRQDATAIAAPSMEIVRARSARRHHATLLHYTAANGVEGERQKTPPNAVAVMTALLDAGAEVRAEQGSDLREVVAQCAFQVAFGDC